MKKLELNKKTIQTLDKNQMQMIDGGICLASCASGSLKGKACCTPGRQVNLTITIFGGGDGGAEPVAPKPK